MTNPLRQLLKEATPGPWRTSVSEYGDVHVLQRGSGRFITTVDRAPNVDADATLIVYLVNRAERYADLEDAARAASTKDADARAVMERMGIVMDKWPPKDQRGAWTDEQIAALDPETRWQGLAFTLYSILALEMAAPLQHALAALTENEEAP